MILSSKLSVANQKKALFFVFYCWQVSSRDLFHEAEILVMTQRTTRSLKPNEVCTSMYNILVFH